MRGRLAPGDADDAGASLDVGDGGCSPEARACDRDAMWRGRPSFAIDLATTSVGTMVGAGTVDAARRIRLERAIAHRFSP